MENQPGIMSVSLAQPMVIWATEAGEEAMVVMASAKGTTEAMVAMGMPPAMTLLPSTELTSLIPSTVSPKMNGNALAAMVGNKSSPHATMPMVNKLPLVEAEAVKEEAQTAQLQP